MSNAVSPGTLASVGIEHVPKVVGMHDRECSDSGERLTLRSVQFVRSVPVVYELALTPAW